MVQTDIVQLIVSLLIGISTSLMAAVITDRRRLPKKIVYLIAAVTFVVATLITSYGYESIVLVEVPTLSGMSKDGAALILNQIGLYYDFEEQYNEKVIKGIVISQDPPVGTVKKGTKIHIVVSKGSSLGTISVNSEPSGASVYLDGELKGTTPITVSEVSAGAHEIKFMKKGYKEWSKSISVSGGSTSDISVSLDEVPTPTPTAPQPTTPTITPTPTPTITPSLPITLKYGDFDALDQVCTYENNYCGWATAKGKAIIYGSMTKSGIKVPEGVSKLKVIINIPCNGWGEGLSGPDGSAALIIVDGISKEERIDSTMKFHHENYYKYEFCSTFTNNFDISGKNEITLKIEMVGAHLDFQQAQLVFS